MDQFYTFLEMHWEDRMGHGFADFRKKYYKLRNNFNLFVNFSNYNRSGIDKTFNTKTDHTDPVGLYAYPLKYVIEHPADIWYGAGAKYLQVIKSTAKNVLWLQYMNEAEAHFILHKLGIDPNYMKLAQKHYKYKRNSAQIGQKFFAAIQFDFTKKTQRTDSAFLSLSRGIEYKMRSGLEQSQLLLKAGFDAVRDSGRNQNYGIINEREPDQMVFLKRSAFEMQEMFQLNQKRNHSLNLPREDSKHDGKRLAAMIFEAMYDKLISVYEDHYFSNKGKVLNINFIIQSHVMKDKKLGEKKHKEDKLYSPLDIHISLFSDRQPINYTFSETKFKDIAYWMKIYYDKSPSVDNFIPYTKERYIQEQKDADNKRIRDYAEKKHKEKQEYYNYNMPKIIEAMKILGIEFKPKDKIDYPHILDSADQTQREAYRQKKDFWEYYKERYRDLIKLAVTMAKEGGDNGKKSDYRNLIDDYYMAKNTPDAKALKELYNKLINNDELWWNDSINKLLKGDSDAK